jgi:ribose transport system permease protein
MALLALGMFVVILAGIDLPSDHAGVSMVALAIASGWRPCRWSVDRPVDRLAAATNGVGLTCPLPHPFIMTLGTLNVARGLTFLISNGPRSPG